LHQSHQSHALLPLHDPSRLRLLFVEGKSLILGIKKCARREMIFI
jgi:hypothetical protein